MIDFDTSHDALYEAASIPPGANRDDGPPDDPFAGQPADRLIGDPAFHAFMVYGVVMKTLARFEYALGRRVCWSFGGPQIQVAPHAFADANAFYAAEAQGLFFGYFPDVNLYKVGHHGSLNATPKSLWHLFKHKDQEGTERLETLCSTKAGKHGSVSAGTEVPRRPLLAELKAKSNFHSTEEIKNPLFEDVVLSGAWGKDG